MTTPVIYNAEPLDWSTTAAHYSQTYANFVVSDTIRQWGPGVPSLWVLYGSSTSSIGMNVTSSATQGFSMIYSCGGSSFPNGNAIMLFYEGSGATLHVSITTDASGHIVAKNGSGTTLGTSTATIVTGSNGAGGAFSHLETIVTCHSSTGSVVVYLDGDTTPILNLTNVNTRNGGTGVITHVRAQGLNGGNMMGQFVWHDGSAQLGWKLIKYVPGTTAGTYSSGTASAGTIQSCVDEQDCNGDTDYVAMDDTSLPKNVTVGVTLPAGIKTLVAVIPHLTARADSIGTSQGRVLLRSASTDSDGGVDVTVPLNYGQMRRVLQTDPATSAAWTTSPTIEVGFRRTV